MPKQTAPDWGNFQKVSDMPRHRLIWRSAGLEKTGKDHFALTAPGPIAILSFDIGLEGVVEKFLKTPLGPKDIRYTEYEFDRNDTTQNAAQDLWDRFVEDYHTALKVARTVIIDTESEAWELARYAAFGEASDAPRNYVALNAMYRDLIQSAYDSDVNLGLLQKMKEKWITIEAKDQNGRSKDKPRNTGTYEPTGMKEVGFLVQANLIHTWDKDRGFVIRVDNCRQNMELAGEEFENLDFPTLAALVFPDTDLDDWQ